MSLRRLAVWLYLALAGAAGLIALGAVLVTVSQGRWPGRCSAIGPATGSAWTVLRVAGR